MVRRKTRREESYAEKQEGPAVIIVVTLPLMILTDAMDYIKNTTINMENAKNDDCSYENADEFQLAPWLLAHLFLGGSEFYWFLVVGQVYIFRVFGLEIAEEIETY